MNPEQLRKILELEKSKGFADTAVSGGLDKYLANLPPADYESLPPPYPSYRSLSKKDREAWISGILKIPASPPKRSAKPRATIKLAPIISPDSLIDCLKGVNTKLAAKFKKLGIETVRDLIYFFPRRHIDYSDRKRIAELQVGMEQTIMGKVWQATLKKSFRGLKSTEAIIADETGTVRVIWFNQPYLARQLATNTPIALSGNVEVFKGQRVFQNPEYEIIKSDDLIHTGRLVPVYPLTSGLYPRQVRKLVHDALDSALSQIGEFLPPQLLKRANLMGLGQAIRQAHYPDDLKRQMAARKRLAFDELFLIQLGMLSKKQQRLEGVKSIKLQRGDEDLNQFLNSLPFELTAAQKKVLDEIRFDIEQTKPMNRLVQGDVGSGKTVVALAGMLMAHFSQTQAAIMAPTEILAEQHFKGICQLLGCEQTDGTIAGNEKISVGLLSGSLSAKSKKAVQKGVAEGSINLLVGTQALIQQKVDFARLGLVVVDEQHRFGVLQRLALEKKGGSPHMLVMSATPIPRTLALTVYGDLDISVIDQLPAGRQPIKTKWLMPKQRNSGYAFIRKQIAEGRQAYIICPLVEESESIDSKAVITEYERLSKEIFPDLKLGLLHGRMSAQNKDDIMRQFRDGQIDILVSTSVVEVGVDVPNATVILVEGADRFGLSQLHQFRGRVWRSSHQGYCMLLSENPSSEARERLTIMEMTANGFVLAEEDLKMRGPGEFFGTRQSGLPDLKMARLSDVKLLEMARAEAKAIFAADPHLGSAEHQALAKEMARLWAEKE